MFSNYLTYNYLILLKLIKVTSALIYTLKKYKTNPYNNKLYINFGFKILLITLNLIQSLKVVFINLIIILIILLLISLSVK